MIADFRWTDSHNSIQIEIRYPGSLNAADVDNIETLLAIVVQQLHRRWVSNTTPRSKK